MKEIDAGHMFLLDVLDGPIESQFLLNFVKRQGEKYPGNKSKYPGTNLQEIYRACIARHKYLDKQKPHAANDRIIRFLELAILMLEERAAGHHNRNLEVKSFIDIEHLPTCARCGHIECKGECRETSI